ncbi:MAG: phosphatidylglycerophosphatase A [Pseudomonadota bacterium]|nr:phosphatidylglycerophosphatase A [Pseudomonadota bacterium]
MKKITLSSALRHPATCIATWFGSGLSPIVSGTAGSLAALPFAYAIEAYLGHAALLAASISIFLIGWWASNQYLKATGRDDDPSEIVVDEVAGQWLLLSFLPLTWQAYLVGFVLFRAFDIVKPWPVSLADQNIKGGLGIMLDDILAALYPLVIYLLLDVLGMHAWLVRLQIFLGGGHVF